MDDRDAMPTLSRSQVLVYGAICVAVLLLGVRWVRSAEPGAGEGGGVAEASAGAGSGSFEVERGEGDLVVHVAGAVREPGLYRLPDGSRVADAVDRAGGPAGDAIADGINLAAPLADGQQVIVPARASHATGTGAAAAAGATSGPISLGLATVEDLDTIEGIGPVTAQEIVEFRDQNGGIASIDDLDQITGIGPATMETLRQELQP